MVRKWPLNGDWRSEEMNEILLWVQAVGLPPAMVTVNNAKKVAATAGRVCDLILNKPKEVIFNNFFRFKATIPVNGKLSPGRFVPNEGKKT